VDSETGEVVPGAQVKIKDENGAIVKELISTDGTETISDLKTKRSYTVLISHPEHSFFERTIHLESNEMLLCKLEKEEMGIQAAVDLANLLDLSPIYFDFDRSDILAASQTELEKVVKILREYPGIRIEIRSHTDIRGNREYNRKLSQRRVEATKTWLVEKGIAPERLETKAYVEERLANNCDESIRCKENEHRKNRRSEFIIIQ